jgi:HlyD family secretion protein
MKKLAFLFLLISCFACQEEVERADAYGNFEADYTTVSTEANGRLLFFNVKEGQTLEKGALIAQVDTAQLHLQRLQLQASIGTLPKKLRSAEPDIQVFKDKKSNLIRERDRIKKLLAAKAATPKQLDDINGQIDVIDQQMLAARSQTQITNKGILAEKAPLVAQIKVIEEQIRKAAVYNPIKGTVMTKLAENSEFMIMGSPLYRIAALDTLTLRAYADGIQIQNVSIGQEVIVLVDETETTNRSLEGIVTWIASEAEFTPKTIQTKEDRVNLVYAMKIAVPNADKRLKIGMPAEVLFSPRESIAKE